MQSRVPGVRQLEYTRGEFDGRSLGPGIVGGYEQRQYLGGVALPIRALELLQHAALGIRYQRLQRRQGDGDGCDARRRRARITDCSVGLARLVGGRTRARGGLRGAARLGRRAVVGARGRGDGTEYEGQ